MDYKLALKKACDELKGLVGKQIDVIDVKQPASVEGAIQLSKIVSKLSPIIGNLLEFHSVEHLNSCSLGVEGKWSRQDPGFPDALFQSKNLSNDIGIEIKAWFPLATEMTARFRDSQDAFKKDNINVALIAWLPEFVFWGKPIIIDILITSGKSIAEARDTHYFSPPDYIVLEPEDTSSRTGNLQQSNTNGYKFQVEKSDFKKAEEYIKKFGNDFKNYKTSSEFQAKVRDLQSKFTYRLDTNFAKVDRIEHVAIEQFKSKIESTIFQGKTIKEWHSLVNNTKQKGNSLLEREIQRLYQSFQNTL